MSVLLKLEDILQNGLPKDDFEGDWTFEFKPSIRTIECHNSIECESEAGSEEVKFCVKVSLTKDLNLEVVGVKLTGKTQRQYYFGREFNVQDYVYEELSKANLFIMEHLKNGSK